MLRHLWTIDEDGNLQAEHHQGRPAGVRTELAAPGRPVSIEGREVRVADEPVGLSAKQYELLLALPGDPTRVFTREELLRECGASGVPAGRGQWAATRIGFATSLGGSSPAKLVVNVWGVGYRLCDQALIA